VRRSFAANALAVGHVSMFVNLDRGAR
jgi:hypothetical protein